MWLLGITAVILLMVVAWVVVLGRRLREAMAVVRQKLRSGAVLERSPGRKDIVLRILPEGGVAHEPVPEQRVRALCLGDEDLRALGALATRCEAVYGGAHDIEWAIENGTVYLLQRRPVTTGSG